MKDALKKAGLTILSFYVLIILIVGIGEWMNELTRVSIRDEDIDREYQLTQDDILHHSEINVWTMEIIPPEISDQLTQSRYIPPPDRDFESYEDMRKRIANKKAEQVSRCAAKVLRNYPSQLSQSDIDHAFRNIDRRCSHLY